MYRWRVPIPTQIIIRLNPRRKTTGIRFRIEGIAHVAFKPIRSVTKGFAVCQTSLHTISLVMVI
jgi:hypothetical protein